MNLIQKPSRLPRSGILIIAVVTAVFNFSLTNKKNTQSLTAIADARAGECVYTTGMMCYTFTDIWGDYHFVIDYENI